MPVAYGLIEPADLCLPQVPPEADRLRIAHLSDLHISGRRRRLDRLANQLTALRLDLVLFTGDYMTRRGDEQAAADAMAALCARLRPNLGMYGVMGNHDTAEMRDRLADLPVRWLHNRAERIPGRPIEIMGLDMLRRETPDAMALVLNKLDASEPADAVGPESSSPSGRAVSKPRGGQTLEPQRPLRLMLCHYPSYLTTASDLGVDILFSGHTHGGQIRLPGPRGGRALINACDLPLRMSSGILRHRRTLIAISRGLGEVGLTRFRLFCKPHVPLYTLRRRSMTGKVSDGVEVLEAW